MPFLLDAAVDQTTKADVQLMGVDGAGTLQLRAARRLVRVSAQQADHQVGARATRAVHGAQQLMRISDVRFVEHALHRKRHLTTRPLTATAFSASISQALIKSGI